MGKSLFTAKKAKRKPRIEIIPMVDVMFLLLVFYILSTIALTVERGVPVSLPTAATGDLSKVDETTVTIDAQGKVFLDTDPVQLESLGEAIRKKATELPGGLEHLRESYIVLNIDMTVPHGSVVRVMDQLREIGVSNFSIATDEGGS